LEQNAGPRDEDQAPPPGTASRRRLFVALAVASALLATGGVVAATYVKSPGQLAAETKAPPLSMITATVEKRVLSDTVVARGSVEASSQFQVTPLGGGQGAAVQVVTAVHVKAGDPVRAGEVLLEVSGRPLIALPGAVPIYRDLKPGDHGTDVAQLQAALKSLGYPTTGDDGGRFGPATKQAVASMYAHLGFDHPVTGVDDQAKLKTAQQAVDAAQRQVDALGAQIHAASGTPATASPGGKSGASGGGESLATQLAYAKKALLSAQDDYRTTVDTTGPMIPISEAVFLPAFPAQVTAFTAKVGDPVKAPLITLSTGRLGVHSQMTPDRAALLKPGMPVEITVTATGKHVAGKVAAIGEPSASDAQADGGQGGGSGGGALTSRVTIDAVEDLGPEWAGKDVQLTVTSASSGADVLVVPLSAVSTGADGVASVVKAAKDASGPPTRRVQVVAGLTGGGFVQVTPVRAGELAQGDQVLVSGS
jgi:peptidoglycan hydrolase-like protein with peptidoglycan-binding domain